MMLVGSDSSIAPIPERGRDTLGDNQFQSGGARRGEAGGRIASGRSQVMACCPFDAARQASVRGNPHRRLHGWSTAADEHLDHHNRRVLAGKRVLRQVIEKRRGNVEEPKGGSKQLFDKGFWVG